MKKKNAVTALLLFLLPAALYCQQTVAVISPCGGIDSVIIPTITDNDHDGMDDVLERLLLQHFMPAFIQFSDESCPGPALDGSGDSNLVVARIFPVPQQYALGTNIDSVKLQPAPVVPAHGLTPGLVWYKPLVMVHAALLYGKDCGLLGHTADVEGFKMSLRYIGADSAAGWMYDTIMQNWMGVTIKTASHAGTPCQQIEVKPYKSQQFPNGIDSILASPDKHGNYLTVGGCNASVICNPGCNNTMSKKNVKPVNIGELNAPLVSDLVTYYSGYAGEDPWATANFLASNSGNAGPIREKMLDPLSTDFIIGHVLTQQEICPLYQQCYGPPQSTYTDSACAGSVYFFNGQPLTQAGTYQRTAGTAAGCDSIITLQLTFLPPATSGYADAVCFGSTYSFNGRLLTDAGIYYDTLQTAGGCDSIIRLTLYTRSPEFYSYAVNICSGENYNFNGQTLNSSGAYTRVYTATNGCDSTVQLLLTVSPLPAVSWGTTITGAAQGSNGIPLNGAVPAGGHYSGPGVYNNVFYPDSSGAGAKLLFYTYTDSLGCTNTTNHVVTVQPTALSNLAAEGLFKVYPNPATDMLTIQLKEEIATGVSIIITDLPGSRLNLPCTMRGSQYIFNFSGLPSGIYYVHVNSGPHSAVSKIIKQ